MSCGSSRSKTWCVLPWIHAATLTDGSVQLCCLSESTDTVNLNKSDLSDYWNSPYIKEVRKKMLAGEQVSDCRKCYEEESNGYRSHRVTENGAWKNKLGSEKIDQIVASTDVSGHLETGMIAIDLRLGNICNLQCIMCQPRESSKWVADSKKIASQVSGSQLKSEWEYKSKIDTSLYEWYKNEKFWDDLESFLPTVREIIVGGGEPMLVKEHMKFIKRCVELGEAGHIHLRYHTNAMLLPEELFESWKHFEKVEMFTSVDGFGDIANYLRYPSQWSQIYENLRTINTLSENVVHRFLFSVNALNIHHMPDFLIWVREQKFSKEQIFIHATQKSTGIQGFVHPGNVHWPQYLNPKVLPKEFKKIVTTRMEECYELFSDENMSKYKGVISMMNSEDWSSKLPTLIDYCKALDKVRGTDFNSVFPELVPYTNSIK